MGMQYLNRTPIVVDLYKKKRLSHQRFGIVGKLCNRNLNY